MIITIAGILAFVVLVVFFLNRSFDLNFPVEIEDATKAERCAEFREASPGDEDVFSLGYKGRIKQLWSGCF